MFAIELMMDHMAQQVGMDPLEFRLLNETSDVRREMLKVGAEMIGWSSRKPNGSTPGPIKRGLGIGVGDWGNGKGKATIVVNVYRNGTIEVLSGAQDIGMGYRTMIGDVVRTHLGLPRELLVVKVGRADYPEGPGQRRLDDQPGDRAQGVLGRRNGQGRRAKTGGQGMGTRELSRHHVGKRRVQGRRQIDGMGEGLSADDGRSSFLHSQ